MLKIKSYIEHKKTKHAVIVGSGFIGMEVCESFANLGITVTMIERLPQVTPGLDADMAVHVQEHLQKNGVAVHTGAAVTQINEDSVQLLDGTLIPADLCLLATGVRPNVELAAQAGITLGETGAILVDEYMQTNVPDIYACGDCIEHYHVVTGKPVYRPLGSTANKTGRIAGESITGQVLAFRGVLGTGIFRVFGLAVAQTGLSEREAVAAGYDVAVCHNIKPDRPEYMGGKEMVIKAIADKKTGRLLGVQIVGFGGVDKRIDVFATAITFKADVADLFHLDLAYAPPFSTTKDPVMYTGMILENSIRGKRPLITAQQLQEIIASGEKYNLIDARSSVQYEEGHVPSARNISQEKLRDTADVMEKETLTITYCNKGVTGNAAQNILQGRGYQRVFNLSGGHKQFKAVQKMKPDNN